MLPTLRLALSTLVVCDYDDAICFFVDKMGFTLIEDTAKEDGKRWGVVSPLDSEHAGLLLARADDTIQQQCIGSHTCGRVSFFLTITQRFQSLSHTTSHDRGAVMLGRSPSR